MKKFNQFLNEQDVVAGSGTDVKIQTTQDTQNVQNTQAQSTQGQQELADLKSVLSPKQRDLGKFRKTLNRVVAKDKVKEFMKSGGDEDSFTLDDNPIPISASKMFPSQNQIGAKQSIKDLVVNTWGEKTGRQVLELRQLLALDEVSSGGVQLADQENPSGTPIYVVQAPAKVSGDKKYWIIDGHHRWSKGFTANPETLLSCRVFTPSSETVDIIQVLKAFHMAIAKKQGVSNTQEATGPNLIEPGFDAEKYTLSLLKDAVAAGEKDKIEPLTTIWKEKSKTWKFPIDNFEKLAKHLNRNAGKMQKRNPTPIIGASTPRTVMPMMGGEDLQQSVTNSLKNSEINYTGAQIQGESRVMNFDNFKKR